MTNHVARLYALALALVIFFVSWAAVAARPWATAQADPRVAALAARQQKLQRESALVQQIVQARYANYRVALANRQAQLAATQAARSRSLASVSAPAPAAAGAVRIVNLPPLVITRTS
jgi:hypothetical protein